MLEGTRTRPYVVSPNPVAFNRMQKMPLGGTPWTKLGRAFKPPGDVSLFARCSPHESFRLLYAEYNQNWGLYKNAPSPLDLTSKSSSSFPNYLKRVYQKMGMNALRTTMRLAALGESLTFDKTDSYGESLFSIPEEETLSLSSITLVILFSNLETITK